MAKTSTRKPKPQPIAAIKPGSKDSPVLTESELGQATGGAVYLKVKMEDVIITSYNT